MNADDHEMPRMGAKRLSANQTAICFSVLPYPGETSAVIPGQCVAVTTVQHRLGCHHRPGTGGAAAAELRDQRPQRRRFDRLA